MRSQDSSGTVRPLRVDTQRVQPVAAGPGDIGDVQSRAQHVQSALVARGLDTHWQMARVVLTVIDLQRRNVGLLGAESIS